jgi:acetyl esterase/lipase
MLISWQEAQDNFHQTARRWNQIDESRVQTTYFTVPGPTGPLAAVRLNLRQGARAGTLLYLHGGGWVFGSVQTHLGAMARLAQVTGMSVVGIDYGLAPQAPFPAGLNDAAGAWRWLRAQAGELELTGPWLVSGDSAGANLALSMMLDLSQLGEPLPDAALLFYGVYSANHQSASHKLCGGGQFGLSSAKMAWYRQQYLRGSRQNPDDPRVSPALGNLQGLPPIYMNAAGLDCLRDDSVLLSQRLGQAGVAHEFKVVAGVTHGFMQMSSELPEALAAFEDAARFVARVLPPS